MRALVREAGLEGEIEVDSAGHRRLARRRPARPPGDGGRARGAAIDARGRGAAGPRRATSRTSTCCSPWTARTCATCGTLAPDAAGGGQGAAAARVRPGVRGADLDVPDPYYGGARGFETVLDMVEAACRGLLADL